MANEFLTPEQVDARIRHLRRVYRSAQTRIRKELKAAALTDFQSFRYREHLKQINATVRTLDKQVKEAAKGIGYGSYKEGVDFAAEALSDIGIAVGDINMGNRVNSAAMQVFADQVSNDLLTANASVKTQARRFLRQTQQTLLAEHQLNRLVSQGVLTGDTRKQSSKTLTAALKKKLAKAEDGARVAIKCKDGVVRRFKADYYAELVCRTQAREASTEGIVRTSESAGITLFEVSAHDGACALCQQFQGKIYSSVAGSDFPMLDSEARPPYHPNCAHVLLPVTEEALHARGKYDTMVELSNQKGVYVQGGDGVGHSAPKDWGELGKTRARRWKLKDKAKS